MCIRDRTVGRLLEGRSGAQFGSVQPSYSIGTCPADFAKLFSPSVYHMLQKGIASFGRKLPGFAAADAVLTAPETRTSSPVRIPRDSSLQAQGIQGLYPCGEGAGYAGGIMSAAVDGMRCAGAVIAQFSPDGIKQR